MEAQELLDYLQRPQRAFAPDGTEFVVIVKIPDVSTLEQVFDRFGFITYEIKTLDSAKWWTATAGGEIVHDPDDESPATLYLEAKAQLAISGLIELQTVQENLFPP